ncbi:MAG: hypothetical protein P4L64_05045 [Caulobacteraceae bacterium]|nr:hypothetical protein [Caulobacteraceae bacterium]
MALIVTSVFAWWKGGPPERLGTLLLAASWLGTDLTRALLGQLMPTALLFASDALVSTGFLIIAVRYSSLWLGMAMLFYASAFALHAVQFDDADAPRWHGMIIYLLLNNILNYLVLLTLAAGTCATMAQRRRTAQCQAKARARAAERAERRLRAPPLPLAGNP